jgi:hypothetical protein
MYIYICIFIHTYMYELKGDIYPGYSGYTYDSAIALMEGIIGIYMYMCPYIYKYTCIYAIYI